MAYFVFCSPCGERLFRKGFRIDGKVYCNRCIHELFEFDVEEEDEQDNEFSDGHEEAGGLLQEINDQEDAPRCGECDRESFQKAPEGK